MHARAVSIALLGAWSRMRWERVRVVRVGWRMWARVPVLVPVACVVVETGATGEDGITISTRYSHTSRDSLGPLPPIHGVPETVLSHSHRLGVERCS